MFRPGSWATPPAERHSMSAAAPSLLQTGCATRAWAAPAWGPAGVRAWVQARACRACAGTPLLPRGCRAGTQTTSRGRAGEARRGDGACAC